MKKTILLRVIPVLAVLIILSGCTQNYDSKKHLAEHIGTDFQTQILNNKLQEQSYINQCLETFIIQTSDSSIGVNNGRTYYDACKEKAWEQYVSSGKYFRQSCLNQFKDNSLEDYVVFCSVGESWESEK